MKRYDPELESVLTFAVSLWGVVFVAALLLLLLFGCGCGGPPASLSLDPLFTPVQVAAIEDARDAWCAANGWCPSWSADGEAHLVKVMDIPQAPPGTDIRGGHESQGMDVTVDGGFLDRNPDMTWVIAAHEMGHLQGIAHHGTSDCTMFWKQVEPRFELTCE